MSQQEDPTGGVARGEADKRREALRVRSWSLRSLRAAPLAAAGSFVVGWLDPEGGETPLAALALVVAFMAAFFGLVGLFGLQQADERLSERSRPSWALPCGLCGIFGGFLGGLVGLIT
ncbi:MAG: hypothetical protein RIR65_2793 [Planctomycetota bacterium]